MEDNPAERRTILRLDLHPFEYLYLSESTPNKCQYEKWIGLTLALDQKFRCFYSSSPRPGSSSLRFAAKTMRRKLNAILCQRFPGAKVSFYGIYYLGLLLHNQQSSCPGKEQPVVHLSLCVPNTLYRNKKSKRALLFQAVHLLQTRDPRQRDIMNIKGFPISGAEDDATLSTPYLMGTFCHKGTFVHFELALLEPEDVVAAQHNTNLLQTWMGLDPRVPRFLELVLLWSATIPYKPGSTTMGPYDFLTMAIHYLVWIGFVPEDPTTPPVARKPRPTLHHLSPPALLYGFFHFYTYFPWHTSIVTLGRGEENIVDEGELREGATAPGVVQIQDFLTDRFGVHYDIRHVRESMEENTAYWESLVLKWEPSQVERLWLPRKKQHRAILAPEEERSSEEIVKQPNHIRIGYGLLERKNARWER